MVKHERKKAAGILFIAAGGVFFATAYVINQIPFFGVATAFIGVGVAFLAQSKSKNSVADLPYLFLIRLQDRLALA